MKPHRSVFCLGGSQLLVKLEFGGQWPLTMRARCSVFRYFPNPLGIVAAKQFVKLEFGELLVVTNYADWGVLHRKDRTL